MSGWCGTTDPRNAIMLVLIPLYLLYLGGLWVYCKATHKVFLESEEKELSKLS